MSCDYRIMVDSAKSKIGLNAALLVDYIDFRVAKYLFISYYISHMGVMVYKGHKSSVLVSGHNGEYDRVSRD
jgi:hypothetical protein